jgi:Phage tail lysozyme
MARVAPPGGGGRPPARGGYRIPSTGPVTPREVYELLIQKGLSTPQAVGVLANMWAESHIDPESDGIDSNGYRSVGLINWNTKGYTNAGQLVTGNPQRDVRAQIDYLFTSTSGLSAGLQGATATDVAGNFADHVEVCQGCATGDTTTPNGWGARRGYASMVQGWVNTGRWPKSSGSAAGGPAGPGGGPGGQGGSCLLSLPLVGCVLSTSSARGLIGGGMVLAAMPVGLIGAVVIVALGFRKSGAGPAIARSAEAAGAGVAFIPGLEGAGAAVAAAGSAERRRSQGRQRQEAERKQASETRAQARNDEAQYRRARARTTRAGSTQRPPPDLPPF